MKRTMLLWIILCALVMTAVPAFAATLSLVPQSQTIAVGGTASVDLVISGLESFDTPAQYLSLGGFWVDITYDPLILAFSSAVFGSFLGDPSLDADASVDSSVSGLVDLFEVSFLGTAELDDLQPDSFTLATLNFTGIALGLSSLDFDFVDLTEAHGYTISDLTTTGADVAVVPIPPSMLLLGMGLAGLIGIRRKFKGA